MMTERWTLTCRGIRWKAEEGHTEMGSWLTCTERVRRIIRYDQEGEESEISKRTAYSENVQDKYRNLCIYMQINTVTDCKLTL